MRDNFSVVSCTIMVQVRLLFINLFVDIRSFVVDLKFGLKPITLSGTVIAFRDIARFYLSGVLYESKST